MVPILFKIAERQCQRHRFHEVAIKTQCRYIKRKMRRILVIDIRQIRKICPCFFHMPCIGNLFQHPYRRTDTQRTRKIKRIIIITRSQLKTDKIIKRRIIPNRIKMLGNPFILVRQRCLQPFLVRFFQKTGNRLIRRRIRRLDLPFCLTQKGIRFLNEPLQTRIDLRPRHKLLRFLHTITSVKIE